MARYISGLLMDGTFYSTRVCSREVYPSLSRQDRNSDQHAAYSVATWLRRADLNGSLSQFLHPILDPEERKIAQIEGWILGVV